MIFIVQRLTQWLYKPAKRVDLSKVLKTTSAISCMELVSNTQGNRRREGRNMTKKRPLKALGLMP